MDPLADGDRVDHFHFAPHDSADQLLGHLLVIEAPHRAAQYERVFADFDG